MGIRIQGHLTEPSSEAVAQPIELPSSEGAAVNRPGCKAGMLPEKIIPLPLYSSMPEKESERIAKVLCQRDIPKALILPEQNVTKNLIELSFRR
jgi:hypothetical protein